MKEKNDKKTGSVKKQTATQKIKALEDKLASFENNFMILADEIDQLKTVITGLGRRLNAAIEVSEDISNDKVNGVIVDQNVKDLEEKVSFLEKEGVIKKSESNVVSQGDFIVGKEVKDGKVINPRVQFAVDTIGAEIHEKLVGLEIGQELILKDGDPSFIVTEIFDIIKKEDKKEKEDK